jgi:Fanconi anemia group M protein
MTPTIYVDSHELRSPVARLLDLKGVNIIIRTIEVGDYILSENCGCERKTAEDALSSFIGEEKGKIFRQCYDLVNAYSHPILIMECDLSDLFIRNIHPSAIWGMLRSIIWGGCAITFTYNAEGTANKLYELAKLEQEGNNKEFSPHGSKTKRTKHEQLEYIISSIPDIGPATTKNLLCHFGNIESICRAGIDELMCVDGIGTATAEKIRGIITQNYNQLLK